MTLEFDHVFARLGRDDHGTLHVCWRGVMFVENTYISHAGSAVGYYTDALWRARAKNDPRAVVVRDPLFSLQNRISEDGKRYWVTKILSAAKPRWDRWLSDPSPYGLPWDCIPNEIHRIKDVTAYVEALRAYSENGSG